MCNNYGFNIEKNVHEAMKFNLLLNMDHWVYFFGQPLGYKTN